MCSLVGQMCYWTVVPFPATLFWWALRKVCIHPLAEDRISPHHGREDLQIQHAFWVFLHESEACCGQKEALASLFHVGWWLKQLSGSAQKHLLTDQQRGKKRWHWKKLSFSMINLANASPCQDYTGTKKVFYYMPWYSCMSSWSRD